MADGRLGVAALAATTNTTVYTVPAGKVATFNIRATNRGSTAVDVRIAVAAAGTPTNAEWIEYDARIGPNSPLGNTGIRAGAGERVVAWASAAQVSIRVEGYEQEAGA